MTMYQWFVKRNESVDGPFSTYELISLSYSSKIEPNDGIATSKTGPWETAVELPYLKFPKFKKKRKKNLNTPTLKLEPTFERSESRSYTSGSSSPAASNNDLDELKPNQLAQDSFPIGKTSPPPFPNPHSNDNRFAARQSNFLEQIQGYQGFIFGVVAVSLIISIAAALTFWNTGAQSIRPSQAILGHWKWENEGPDVYITVSGKVINFEKLYADGTVENKKYEIRGENLKIKGIDLCPYV